MLVLSRRKGEKIHVGDGVVITVLDIGGRRARIGIDAPPEVEVLRDEVRQREVQSQTERTLTEAIPQLPR